MDLLQAMKERHSVRSYDEKSIEAGTVEKLRSFIKECNKESGLHIQILFDEPKCFDSMMAHYGKFTGVKNYFAVPFALYDAEVFEQPQLVRNGGLVYAEHARKIGYTHF